MQCSLCDKKAKVVSTRDKDATDNNIPARYRDVFEGNYVYRKHVCECGNMFETMKVDVDDVIRLSKKVRQDIIGKVMDLMVKL